MQALAGVFFQMHACDANALASASLRGDFDVAVLGKRLVVLRDLVALGEIGIEVILAGKDRVLANLAVEGHRREYREFHRQSIEHRESAWQPEAHRTNIRVRRIAELRRAAAENLAFGQKMYVIFQPDARPILKLGCDWFFRGGGKVLLDQIR